MYPCSENYCDFQQFFSRNKARNAANKPKCGISRTIAGRLTPIPMTWVNGIWSDDHDHVGAFAVDRGQVEFLISVDGWLSGLHFDGFADQPSSLANTSTSFLLLT